MRYEYVCDKCSDTAEVDLPIRDRDRYEQAPCIKCHGKMHRSVGCAGFRLLGSCWYSDNYSRHVGDTPAFKAKYGDQRRKK